jgi:hypothetical protein
MPYEHDKYWPALHELCNKRRKHFEETWRKLGGTIGLSEYDLQAGPVGTTTELSEKNAGATETTGNAQEKEAQVVTEGSPVKVAA